MGFSKGFASGVVATVVVGYFSLRVQQRNRQSQSAVLRSQTSALDTSPTSVVHNPYSQRSDIDVAAGIAAPPRAQHQKSQGSHDNGLVESAKDAWNREVERAVRTVQDTDWNDVRENAEQGTARMWDSVVGHRKTRDTPLTEVEAKGGRAVEGVQGFAEETGREGKELAHRTREGIFNVGEKGGKTWDTQQDRAKQYLKDKERKAARLVKGAGEEMGEAWDAQRDRAKQFLREKEQDVDRAMKQTGEAAERWIEQGKTEVQRGLQEGGHKARKMAEAVDTEIQKAAQKRYDGKTAESDEQAVRETLDERYKPSDRRNHLKGL